MKKGGFGLSESPRLWYQRFKRGAELIGGREMALCPGVFGFFVDAQERPRALLAVHVDDVGLVVDPEAKEEIKGKLDSLFSFGDWQKPEQCTKFRGRYERQLPEGAVHLQMDEYAERLLDPPLRLPIPSSQMKRNGLGTICGQLNWMARQCRADLSFGVSRVQQLAGVDDPGALTELKILVERAKISATIKYEHLGCDLRRIYDRWL